MSVPPLILTSRWLTTEVARQLILAEPALGGCLRVRGTYHGVTSEVGLDESDGSLVVEIQLPIGILFCEDLAAVKRTLKAQALRLLRQLRRNRTRLARGNADG